MNELELQVFDEIRESISGTFGRFDVSVENEEVLIDVTGVYEWQYEQDLDYHTGTGEYTTIHALVEITSCDVQGDVDFDIDKVVNYVEDYMYNC